MWILNKRKEKLIKITLSILLIPIIGYTLRIIFNYGIHFGSFVRKLIEVVGC